MKKFIVTALCAVVALCSIPFAACSSSENNGLINLADCEIGYELPVYPDCEFDYKVDDDCVVHISEIKAVLTAKNEINEGDIVEGYFTPYEITAYASGYTSADLCGEKFDIHLLVKPGSTSYYGIIEILQDGTFECEFPCNFGTSFTTISFYYMGQSLS